MDGVPMISQCPILPYTNFRYEIMPESTGTHFYHAHSVQQQGDGLYGLLIVRGPSDEPATERVFLISASCPAVLSELLPSVGTTAMNVSRQSDLVPNALVLNGQKNGVRIAVETGKTFLLRIVNAIAFNCPVIFYIAQHDFDVVATDGKSTEATPTTRTDRIIIFPGERFDLRIEGNGTSGHRYAVALRGLENCRGLVHEASLDYRSMENEHETTDEAVVEAHLPLSFLRAVNPLNGIEKQRAHMFDATLGLGSLDLKCKKHRDSTSSSASAARLDEEERSPSRLIKTIYVPFDVHRYDDIVDGMTDYSFNIYDPSYYPSFLSGADTGVSFGRIAQVNEMSFEYPSSPILSGAGPQEPLCSVEECEENLCAENKPKLFRGCTQILGLEAFETFHIVLIDKGFGDNVSHTFHAHGYDAEIVGHARFNEPVTRQRVVRVHEKSESPLFCEGKAVLKDTFVVPNKGYLVLRIHTNNTGYWLWEARSTGLYGINDGHPPMQFILSVGSRENVPTLPMGFPTCGDYKSPASIFHDAE
ncbi:putative laccase-9 isoform X2 [Venturia canescens]|nr:putative laccase-9 isoform X2 [Venturia canescens]